LGLNVNVKFKEEENVSNNPFFNDGVILEKHEKEELHIGDLSMVFEDKGLNTGQWSMLTTEGPLYISGNTETKWTTVLTEDERYISLLEKKLDELKSSNQSRLNATTREQQFAFPHEPEEDEFFIRQMDLLKLNDTNFDPNEDHTSILMIPPTPNSESSSSEEEESQIPFTELTDTED